MTLLSTTYHSTKAIQFKLKPACLFIFCALALSLLCNLAQAQETDTQPATTDFSPLSYIAPRSADLQSRLIRALQQKPDGYSPRTQHIDDEGNPLYTNRLILESSPYLIQHAHNPVDWHPWSKAALEKARRENKPVFLSIGYSTCHWCHVMERESFEETVIAEYLNRHFIAIKVDREEYPDIDQTYMMAAQLISQRGGWPLTAFITASGEPFFASTYYPPDQFLQLLQKVRQLWLDEQPELSLQAKRITTTIQHLMQGDTRNKRVGSSAIKQAQIQLLQQHDELSGGFGNAPKFPQESLQFLLIKLIDGEKTDILLDIFKTNLNAMQQGGIFDQVGGGFHRYATDPEWQIPHFEKMLYNQALLARIYLQGWRLTGEYSYRDTTEATLNYVLREMTGSNGLFYSATDADSNGEEGLFFVWQEQEIRQKLPPQDADLAISLYGVTTQGNFEQTNILHLPRSLDELAAELQRPLDNLRDQRNQINKQLLNLRQQRIPPGLDNKIISAWNSMMITAFAEAGKLLDREDYLTAAVRAAETMWLQCRNQDGGLQRICIKADNAAIGVQEDYAYFAQALITLYDISEDSRWLDRAILITREMNKRFWDQNNAGYFLSEQSLGLPLRPRSIQDGSIPSGNSIAHEVLHKLYTRTGREHYSELSEKLINQASGYLSQQPMGLGYLLGSMIEQRKGETGPLAYAARGNVSARGDLKEGKITIKLNVADGWHINSNQPLQPNLQPTSVTMDEKIQADIHFPEPLQRSLKFQATPLSLFEGENLIDITFDSLQLQATTIRIALQACNDKLCLPPEEVELSLRNAKNGY
ncbi:DUF255 domain-containing protein [Amphritea balenae]|uniref:DUF255 domain-containing protein n=1 Tax=Amphritea balenae TaxID=452629 RepID=A0A3P1ST97_9GAMM|nr:DUF255 domain-containing protein [Amphritea balenae]RRD00371.1 DUF255 domain-containing protein [Amphritea balenae]